MSTLLAGALAAKREDADEGTSTDKQAPAIKPYVDAMAALVPAEVIALNAVVLGYATTTSEGGSVTAITEPDALKVAFYFLIVLSWFLFLTSRYAAKDKDNKAPSIVVLAAQSLIPPLAFVVWTLLQPVSAFDVIDLGMSSASRAIAAVVLAAFLGAAAAVLGYRLDAQAPTQKKKKKP